VAESKYGIETKFGSVSGSSHRLKAAGRTVYNTATEYFPAVGPRESLNTPGYNEIVLWNTTKLSFNDAVVNITKWRGDNNKNIVAMTIRNQAERQGKAKAAAVSAKAEKALSDAGYKDGAVNLEPGTKIPDWETSALKADDVGSAADSLNIKTYNVNDFEDPEKSASVSTDDIRVKAQNPERPMPAGMEKKKRVDISVAHFQSGIGKYTLTADGVRNVLKLTLAFMLSNGILLKQPLVFYTDGARTIHNEIESMFSFTNFKIILDWYHLQKKFAEFFSMAFKGKEIRNAQLNAITPLLWFGNVDGAVSFLRNADPSKVKSNTHLEQLVDYLNRVRPYIPNYALRKKLGLRNSSNLLEKSNDLVVAKRQKNNGMSWSQDGSLAMASVSCACVNGELGYWVNNKEIPFKPIPNLAKAA
jgi:hypothetical protein